MSAKKHKPVKLALALIVKGDDEEADRLNRCLTLSAAHVDGIFVTITQPNERVEDVCREHHATVSHFTWCNDFAAARNFNFSQVPADYTHILWLDADDGLRGIEQVKQILTENPEVDTFIVNYLYAFDEKKNPVIVHMKTQLVKNDGCVRWIGAIHEDFEATRDITPYFIKDVERIHISEGDRIERSKDRNLTIAKEQAIAFPNDPRSYWNLGNAYRAKDSYELAMETFDRFLALSLSDDEKYLCRMRRAECVWAMGDTTRAIDEARYAIGLKPAYPDAYNLLGALYLETSQYENAANTYLQALTKKPPVYSILIYNPRDYDYVPMKNLAKAYWNMSRPDLARPLLEGCLRVMPTDTETRDIVKHLKKEEAVFNKAIVIAEKLRKMKDKDKLKKKLDSLSPELQAHPAISVVRNVNFQKETSSGKDIVFYCGGTVEVWNPQTAKEKGIGGSEEAVIWLSRLLHERGWNVEVYANCGTEAKVYDGVTWKPFWLWNVRDKQDVVVLWRSPGILKHGINATKIYVDLHDVVKDGEFTPERLEKITKVFVKSAFHRSLIPSVPDDKVVICPNGIDASVFSGSYERDPMLMINTSSAERSLSALLDCYEEVKKQVPTAKLQWSYGWGVFDTAHGANQRMMDWKRTMQKRMKELGVIETGRISHDAVAKLYMTANIFAYPSEFAEIDCISLSKAMAGGATPITTDFSAMGEKQHHGGIFVHSKKTKADWAEPYQTDFAMTDPAMKQMWVASAVALLNHPATEAQRVPMRTWARDAFDWNKVADIWHHELCG